PREGGGNSPGQPGKNTGGGGGGRGGDHARGGKNRRTRGGFAEGGNRTRGGEMMSSIAMNRQFEAQIKMMKTAEDISDAGNRLLRGS
ncbi:hypothetical protein KCA24_35505, partial [Escherichia coli]|nr:hypothetical protein [Escherichia coli]